jgi:hypothetical protein
MGAPGERKRSKSRGETTGLSCRARRPVASFLNRSTPDVGSWCATLGPPRGRTLVPGFPHCDRAIGLTISNYELAGRVLFGPDPVTRRFENQPAGIVASRGQPSAVRTHCSPYSLLSAGSSNVSGGRANGPTNGAKSGIIAPGSSVIFRQTSARVRSDAASNSPLLFAHRRAF